MDSALEKINHTTTDITERLTTLLSTSKSTLSHQKKALNSKILSLNATHISFSTNTLKECDRLDIRVEKLDNLKTVVTAYSNLVFINKLNEKKKRIEIEFKEFYDNLDDLEVFYNIYDDLEEFCLFVNERRFEKLRIDFFTSFLEVDFFDTSKTNLIFEIIEKEEFKDYCTNIAKQQEKFQTDSKEGVIAEAYKHYQSREPINLLKSFKDKIKDDLIKKDLFDLVESIKVVLKMPDCIDKNEIVDFVNANVQLPQDNLLDAIQFQDAYMAVLQENLIFKKPLMKESVLIENYISSCSTRIHDWVSVIQNKIISEFILRDTVPGADECSKYISIDFINLLELIRNQLEPVSFKPSIWKKIVNLISDEITKFGIKEIMEDELDDAVKLKGKAGYEEYVIMISNSSLKVAQCIDESEWANVHDNSNLKQVFVDLMKSSNKILANFIIRTCAPVTTMIFIGEYNVKKLIATIEDFLGDYSVRMLDYTFYDMVLILMDEIVGIYLKQMTRKNAKLDPSILERDYECIYKSLCAFMEEGRVIKKLEAMKYAVPIIKTTNVDLFISEVKALKLRHPQLNKEFCKILIGKKTTSESVKLEMRRRLKEIFGGTSKQKKGFFNMFF